MSGLPTILLISPEGEERKRHWRLSIDAGISPRADRREVMRELRSQLDKAVQRVLPPDGPVHTHLSGGLDSSAIAVLTAASAPDREAHGYAFGPRPLPDPDIVLPDERPALRAIAARYPHLQLHEITGPNAEALGTEPMNWVFPTFAGDGDLYEQVIRHAAETGGRTLLSGFGGDEVVSYAGNGALAEMFMGLRWLGTWKLAGQLQRHTHRPAWRAILSEIRRFAVPGFLSPGGAHRLGQNRDGIRDLFAYLRPELHDVAAAAIPEIQPSTRWMRRARLEIGSVTWIQEQLAQTAGHHGLRYSSPLLDRELLEFAIQLPPEFLFLDGLPRAGLREPLEGLLPDESRLRMGKLHFDPGGAYYFARDADQLRGTINGLAGTAAETIFDLDALEQEIRAIPSAEEALAGLRESAETGQQWFLAPMRISQSLLMARFTARADEELKRLHRDTSID